MLSPRPEIEDYIQRSNQYWQQSLGFLSRNELEKASELAWGSVVERVKALALAKVGVELRSHRQVRDYVKRVASQAKDEELYRYFREGESLHINFYESFFDPEEVRRALAAIEQVLVKIDSYLEVE